MEAGRAYKSHEFTAISPTRMKGGNLGRLHRLQILFRILRATDNRHTNLPDHSHLIHLRKMDGSHHLIHHLDMLPYLALTDAHDPAVAHRQCQNVQQQSNLHLPLQCIHCLNPPRCNLDLRAEHSLALLLPLLHVDDLVFFMVLICIVLQWLINNVFIPFLFLFLFFCLFFMRVVI